ncbi:oxidoreductase [Herbaspirillum sp. LeCh32-8]|uniref:oxidoreductase-like domain-containing protein n=1 Tax=Herbaspirillum sp. LeCh32-8 TaxID=2821356 RepID=UPI001AEB15DA|nr:oxidoreductase-like domain-containing protein [Herbaspirillum sp. LeCh32-8]MBP0599893.1 oxidoreductase [Herbaspirillum sp. LeCh32-8]
MRSSKQPAEQSDDPRPTPPVEPALEDCCGSGCVPCIFDIYEQQRERYQQELEAWNARQAQRAAGRKAGAQTRR